MRSLSSGTVLLKQAAVHALTNLGAVTAADLAAPTPCTAWDLRSLLDHLADAADALTELIITHRMAIATAHGERDNPIDDMRRRTMRLIEACPSADREDAICEIGDRVLLARTAAGVGAIEFAVHGWDIAQACGIKRPIPDGLATSLLDLALLVAPPDDRWPEFGPPLAVARSSSASDRLLAHLGRHH